MNITVAVLEASVLGSLIGSIFTILVSAVAGPAPTIIGDLMLIPVLIVAMSLVAFFVLLPSLVLLGIPLAFLFANRLPASVLSTIAIVLGGGAGWLVAELIRLDLPAAGPAYGAAAGLFWYLRVRLVMLRIKEGSSNAPLES